VIRVEKKEIYSQKNYIKMLIKKAVLTAQQLLGVNIELRVI